MKMDYEHPQVKIELFTPNNVFAACEADTTLIFDCLLGGQKDSENVLSDQANVSGCTIQAYYAANATKVQASSTQHTTDGSFVWQCSGTHGQFSQDTSNCIGTAEGALGVLYYCDGGQSHWTVSSSGVVSHSSSVQGVHHGMVLPIYGSSSSDVATS